jgi:hypothetical protein
MACYFLDFFSPSDRALPSPKVRFVTFPVSADFGREQFKKCAKQQNQWWFYLSDVEKRNFIILNASTIGGSILIEGFFKFRTGSAILWRQRHEKQKNEIIKNWSKFCF